MSDKELDALKEAEFAYKAAEEARRASVLASTAVRAAIKAVTLLMPHTDEAAAAAALQKAEYAEELALDLEEATAHAASEANEVWSILCTARYRSKDDD